MASYLQRAREPLSSLTHLWGAALSGVGLIFLLCKAIYVATPVAQALSGVLFALSLLALYTASAVYHFSNGGARRVLNLRKLDHAMIYVLIAGSYTPILLYYFPEPRNYIFTAIVWGIGLTGIAAKLLWFNAPRLLYTFFYIFMGWFIVFDLPSLSRLDPGAMALLIAGGLSYTVGGAIYALKKPSFTANFGYHEIFHLFVILGSLLHYLIVLLFVL